MRFTETHKRRITELLVLTMLAWWAAVALMEFARSELAPEAACPHCLGHLQGERGASDCDEGAGCALHADQGPPGSMPADQPAIPPPLAGSHDLYAPPLQVAQRLLASAAAIDPPPRLRFCILLI